MAIDKDKVVIARLVGLTKRNKTKDGVSQSLVWSIRNNMPRLTAYLDNNKMLHPNGGLNYDYILTARFTPQALLEVLDGWKTIIKKGEQDFYETDCIYPKIIDGKVIEDEKVVSAVIRCGIDANKICYIYIKEPNKQEIKFNFDNSIWHVSRTSKNGEIDVNLVNRLSFLKYIEMVENVILEEERKSNVERCCSSTNCRKSYVFDG
jgi:hypothetical protein